MADPFDELQSLYIQLQTAQDARVKEDVVRLSSQILGLLEGLPPLEHLGKSQRARALLYKGKALSAQDTYDKQAEEALTRSVKLDPSNADTWIWLGEIFYLKKDYLQSKRCFEGSIENSGENKLALRKLSMVSRLIGDDTERKRAVRESVDLAKKALGLDLKDGYSWYVLANAHLTNFFMNCPGSDELSKALKAYAQAEKLLSIPEPDLHYNRGEAYKYLERYQDAVSDFLLAHQLDPELQAEREAMALIERVRSIVVKITTKNGLKKKPLQNIVRSIPSTLNNKPFGGGYKLVSLREVGPRTVLACKVICPISENPSDVPALFLACDIEGEFFCLSVYNTNPYIHQNINFNAGIFVRDPVLAVISLTIHDATAEYKAIRVTDPSTLMVNEKNIYEAFSPASVVNQPIN